MPWKVGALADRDLDRDDLGGEARLDALVDAVEVGVLLVQHRDDEEHGILPRDGLAEHDLGADLDAGRGGDDDERAVGGGESGDRVAQEVGVARGVDEIDLGVHPLGVGAAEVDGVLALDLLGGEVGERGAVLDGAVALGGPGNESERVDQSGLPARAVSHDRDVADLRTAIFSHREALREQWPLEPDATGESGRW